MVSMLSVVTAILAAAAPPGGPIAGQAAGQVAPVDLSASFYHWSIQNLDLPEDGAGAFQTTVTLDGGVYTLVLDPYSVRSDRFQVLAERNGEMVEIAVADPRTYRGYIEGVDSEAGGSLISGKLRVVIEMAGFGAFGIQPVSDFIEGYQGTEHVVYATKDSVTDDEWRCGTDDLSDPFGGMPHNDVHGDAGGDGGSHTAGGDKTAELAFDMDNEYYTRRGSADACIADIEAIVAGMDVIYERDVNICHRITTIIIRDTSNDPYSGTDAETILTQFQNHWNNQQQGIQRDLAHMFAGRSRDGGILGIAYLSSVCNRSIAYGVAWTLFTSNMTQRIGLTAHECGHGWGAQHCCGSCSGCNDCRIMCPCLGGCSGILTSFGATEKSQITNFRNSRSCLEDGCGGGGGGVPCEAIKALKARCRANGTIKGKVILFDATYDGQQVIVSVDGNNITATIDVDRALYDICCFSGPDHTVTLVDPGNCASRQVDCN